MDFSSKCITQTAYSSVESKMLRPLIIIKMQNTWAVNKNECSQNACEHLICQFELLSML